jgi:hypothetical protein
MSQKRNPAFHMSTLISNKDPESLFILIREIVILFWAHQLKIKVTHSSKSYVSSMSDILSENRWFDYPVAPYMFLLKLIHSHTVTRVDNILLNIELSNDLNIYLFTGIIFSIFCVRYVWGHYLLSLLLLLLNPQDWGNTVTSYSNIVKHFQHK